MSSPPHVQFYGEITQQLLKNAAFPGSNNGTGLFQVRILLALARLSCTAYTLGHQLHQLASPSSCALHGTWFEPAMQTLVGLKIREVYEHITQKDLAPAVSR
jgi:hypothetical protein